MVQPVKQINSTEWMIQGSSRITCINDGNGIYTCDVRVLPFPGNLNPPSLLHFDDIHKIMVMKANHYATIDGNTVSWTLHTKTACRIEDIGTALICK